MGDAARTRALFERCITLQLPAKKMKVPPPAPPVTPLPPPPPPHSSLKCCGSPALLLCAWLA